MKELLFVNKKIKLGLLFARLSSRKLKIVKINLGIFFGRKDFFPDKQTPQSFKGRDSFEWMGHIFDGIFCKYGNRI